MNRQPNTEFVLEAFRETYAKTERGNEIHSAACIEVYELKKQNSEMFDRLNEIAEYQRRVVSEQCAPDETHCTCVPALRNHITELEEFLGNTHDRWVNANNLAEARAARIAELESVCKQAIETGKQQAGEWDRFWQAMGVCSEEITVDDAIAEYKAMRDDRDQLRAMNIDAENLLAGTRERVAGSDERIKELEEALKNAANELSNAQGVWASVSAAFAPVWVHELKDVESECLAVLENK